MLWCNLWFASFFGDNQECFAFDRKLVPDYCRLKNEIDTEGQPSVSREMGFVRSSEFAAMHLIIF